MSSLADALGVDPDKVWHIYPLDDLKEHSTDSAEPCDCKPKMEMLPNGNVNIIHNAWDQRETREKDNKNYKKQIKA